MKELSSPLTSSRRSPLGNNVALSKKMREKFNSDNECEMKRFRLHLLFNGIVILSHPPSLHEDKELSNESLIMSAVRFNRRSPSFEHLISLLLVVRDRRIFTLDSETEREREVKLFREGKRK